MIQLKENNIVIIAHDLNPTIFKQTWLIKQGIFTEDEMLDSSFYTPAAVNVRSKNADLLIVTDRLQLSFSGEGNHEDVANRIILKIVNALPHTPYTAIGFNFIWIAEPVEGQGLPSFLRETLLSNTNPLSSYFYTDDARFGMYLSKDFLGMRMNLDIRPVLSHEGQTRENLRLAFNFHVDIKEEAVKTISNVLKNWLETRKISDKIINEVSRGWT